MPSFFDTKTSAVYRSHKARAKAVGQVLDYSLEAFRTKVHAALGEQRCSYCGEPICETTFQVDHATPTSRRGSFSLWNLHITCKRCNKAKSILSAHSWIKLLELLNEFHPDERADIWRRLLHGWKFT